MAFTNTTSTSAAAWSPDVYSFAPGDAVIMACATQGGIAEGDSPVTRVAYIDDDTAVFKAEGAELDEAEPALSEELVYTSKATMLVRLSREQFNQPQTADQIASSVSRALVRKADAAFLAQADPNPASAPVAGLINTTGLVDAGPITDSLDGLIDLIASLQANRGTPTHIVLDPLGWAEFRKLKTGTDYNSSLLGAGTTDAVERLLSLPVIVNNEMTAHSGLVIDKTAIVSALGPVNVATDESTYFTSDSIACRGTWRFGHVVVRPNRCGKFTIGSGS